MDLASWVRCKESTCVLKCRWVDEDLSVVSQEPGNCSTYLRKFTWLDIAPRTSRVAVWTVIFVPAG
jgi:hypothetical protein